MPSFAPHLIFHSLLSPPSLFLSTPVGIPFFSFVLPKVELLSFWSSYGGIEITLDLEQEVVSLCSGTV